MTLSEVVELLKLDEELEAAATVQAAIDELAGLRAAEERAFQVLETAGIPRHRSRNVPNGIDVLITRMRRSNVGQ